MVNASLQCSASVINSCNIYQKMLTDKNPYLILSQKMITLSHVFDLTLSLWQIFLPAEMCTSEEVSSIHILNVFLI